MSPCMTLDYFSFLSAFPTLFTGRTVNISFRIIHFMCRQPLTGCNKYLIIHIKSGKIGSTKMGLLKVQPEIIYLCKSKHILNLNSCPLFPVIWTNLSNPF